MLKIIMGMDEVNKYGLSNKFVISTSKYFNTAKKAEWFKKDLVKEIVSEIDNADILLDFALYSRNLKTGYSVNDLSGGSKYLILTLCDRDKTCLATMEDNCTDFLERISLEYEKEGKDLTIVSNYLHEFNFKYIKEIEYINWSRVVKSKREILDIISPLWQAKWTLPKDFDDAYWEEEE